MIDDQLLRVQEVAARLDVSRTLVYRLMEAGELAYVKLGRTRRIPTAALKSLVAKNLRGGGDH